MHYLLAIIGVIILLSWCSPKKPVEPVADRPMNGVDALQICRGAFRVLLLDPEKAEIPWRAPRAGALGFMFVWEHGGGMRVRNGLGLDAPTTAVCWVMPDKTIRALKIGDDDYIIDGKVMGR